MRISLKTSAQSFVSDLAKETGIELQMAQGLETLSMSVMRSYPMPADMANGLLDHLITNTEIGDGIARLKIVSSKDNFRPGPNDTRLIIRSDMEDTEFGNINRFMRGEQPGLTLANIFNASRFNSIPDHQGMISVQPPPAGNHMAAAVRSYLASLVTAHRGYRLDELSNGEFRAVPVAPVEQSRELSVPHAYHTMKDLLHRDRAIPMPSGDSALFNAAVINEGCQALGIVTSPTATANDRLFALTDRVRDSLLHYNGNTKIDGVEHPDASMTVAHIMLMDAYVMSMAVKYPDIPASTMDDVCELSRTTHLLETSQMIVSNLHHGQFPRTERTPAPVSAIVHNHTLGDAPGM